MNSNIKSLKFLSNLNLSIVLTYLLLLNNYRLLLLPIFFRCRPADYAFPSKQFRCLFVWTCFFATFASRFGGGVGSGTGNRGSEKKNFEKSFGERKIFLPLQPATEVTTEGKKKD